MDDFPTHQLKKAAFLDVGVFAQEGFTNGIFITIREIFRRLEKMEISTAILSISTAPNEVKLKGISNESVATKSQGVSVNELLLSTTIDKDPDAYMKGIKKLLKEYQPSVLFMNTPAVFFEDFHTEVLRTVVNSGTKLVMILADSLYPTVKKHPSKNVKAYYDLLQDKVIIATSTTLIEQFQKDVGLKASYFPNIFSTTESYTNEGSHEYITLVNHHPIKGREVFNSIAKKMPDKNFLIVETWPDVPPYIPPSDNIVFSKFIPDVRELYKKTRILLIPSLYEEGPARIITEAMLNGIPVIAHRIGCLPEVGKDHIYLVEPPVIYQTDMVGTILYPRVTPEEMDKASDRFVEIIRKIDENHEVWLEQSRIARDYAEEYCRQVEIGFLKFVTKWFE